MAADSVLEDQGVEDERNQPADFLFVTVVGVAEVFRHPAFFQADFEHEGDYHQRDGNHAAHLAK